MGEEPTPRLQGTADIRETPSVRRGIAGLFFFVAAIALALAAGGWWLQRVAFDTGVSAELAEVVLQEPEIRAEIANVTANAAADTLGVPVEQLRGTVDGIAQTRAGAELMQEIVADSHARLIGARSEPVQITGQQLVQIVRDERAADIPPVVLPVEEVTVLIWTRTTLEWAVPLMAIAGGVALALGLIAHPRKADAVFGIGTFCIFAGIAALVLGLVLPIYGVPALTGSAWLSVIPAIAEHNWPFVVIISAALVLGGLGLMMAAASARRRRAWSAPVSVHRYGDQRL